MLFKKKKGKGYGEILFNKTVKYTSLVRILQEKQQHCVICTTYFFELAFGVTGKHSQLPWFER